MEMLLHWLVAALAIGISAWLLPGVGVQNVWVALITAVVLGLLNTFLAPILTFLTLPLNIITLGLFTLVINAAIIMLASAIVPGFSVQNFGWALAFGVVLMLVNALFTTWGAERWTAT